MKQFQIDKTIPNRFRIKQTVDSPDNAQTEGAGKAKNVVIKIERFAFTANNLTYYMVGDKLGYWQFFPPINTSSNENPNQSTKSTSPLNRVEGKLVDF